MPFRGLFGKSKSKRKLPPGPDLDILIVGKTGHGKSATANSILGDEHFESSGDTTSVTALSGMLQKEIDGRYLLVVDTPGLCDTGVDDEKSSLEKAEEDFCLALSFSPDGYHAILIVYQFGTRMTKEERNTISNMKELLGETFIRDHGVLVITHGDEFQRKMKKEKSFETWCSEQKGAMEEILQEFQYRYVLFNNEAKKDEMHKQRYDLIQMIYNMKGGQRYNEGIFKTITQKWKEVGDPGTRNSYLNANRIFFDMTSLTARAKVFDKKFVDKMRDCINQLKASTKDMNNKDTKAKMERQIENAENQLNQMERQIQESKDGYITDNRFANGILQVAGTIVSITSTALYQMLGTVVLSVTGVFDAVWESLKQTGQGVKNYFF